MNESAPALSMIFSATTRDPLPDTGRRNIRDISSFGIEKNSQTGAAAFSDEFHSSGRCQRFYGYEYTDYEREYVKAGA